MRAVAEREVAAPQDRGALAKMVMALLEHWKLSTEDQAALLGIASSNRAVRTADLVLYRTTLNSKCCTATIPFIS